VSGGISLRPEEFTIRKDPASPALQKFKRLAQGATLEAGPGGKGGRLVRSRSTGKSPAVASKGAAAAAPEVAATFSPKTATSPQPRPPAAAPASPVATATRTPQGKAAAAPSGKASPPPVAKAGPERVPGLVAARIVVPAGAAGAAGALGELAVDGRIVFRRVSP
jgi:hypothetical protein